MDSKEERFFDDEESWRTQPRIAFDSFIGSADFVLLGRRDLVNRSGDGPPDAGPIGAASAKVYGTMFSSFLRRLDELGVQLPDATSAQISEFIGSGERTEGVRQRYVRVLERVYEHLRRRGFVETNPVSRVATLLAPGARVGETESGYRPAKPELPTAFVNPSGVDRVAAHVESMIAATRDRGDWRSVRDAAMAAVLLGAGLKIYELGAMRTSWISGKFPDYQVEVQRVGVSRVHRVPLSPFTAECLKSWLDLRTREGLVQPLLFVASLRDGRMQNASGALDKSTVYRRIKGILEAADVEAPRMGGRTLRNTFAVTALNEGGTPELVGERLGLREEKSMRRYLKAAGMRTPD